MKIKIYVGPVAPLIIKAEQLSSWQKHISFAFLTISERPKEILIEIVQQWSPQLNGDNTKPSFYTDENKCVNLREDRSC